MGYLGSGLQDIKVMGSRISRVRAYGYLGLQDNQGTESRMSKFWTPEYLGSGLQDI